MHRGGTTSIQVSSLARSTMPAMFLTLLLTLTVMQAYGDIMDSYKASLDSLVNDNLGVQTFENSFQQLPFKMNAMDGHALVAQMASDMSDRLQTNSDLVLSTRRAIEQSLGQGTGSAIQKCSDVSARDYDVRFRNKTDLTSMCVFGSNSNNILDNSVLTTMRNNLRQYPTLRWQYFGTETGQTFIYPAVNRNITDIDPRTRVWYTATANSRPKDVVILVQSSQSMSSVDQNNTPLIQIAKSAATLLIDTLNPDDRFGVVSFSKEVSTKSSDTCYSNELVAKSPSSTKDLEQFIKDITPADDGTYAGAFSKAFALLNNTSTSSVRDRVVIILTNGYGIENDFNRTAAAIRDGQRMFQNKVDIFAFGIGRTLNNDRTRQNYILQLLSNAILDPQYESADGQFSPLNNVTSYGLRTDMTNYFTRYSSIAINVHVTYSTPYTDFLGLGLLMSMCLPVSVGGQLKGVTCVDVTIDALFSEVSYFQQGSSSYAFLMDDYGRLLLHPYLPTQGVSSENSIFPDIRNVENDFGNSVEQLRSAMLAHTNGSLTFNARRVYPRGVATLDGVDVSYAIAATYFWQPVLRTNFTVCVVISNSDVNRSVDWQSPTLPPVFLSNEFSIQNLPPDSCNNYGRITRRDTTVVTLAATSFQQPSVYLDVPITNDTVQRWKSFLVNPTQTSTEIKAGVREAVAATYVMENFWRNSRNVSKFAVWRYIGTKEGVFRKFPGSRMVLEYDATKRPWYQQAVADVGRTSFYGPYVDASKTGCYISIAKAVSENNSLRQIAAVLALDATVGYYLDQLKSHFSPCSQSENTCFVIDRSGFLLIHNSFYPTSLSCDDISNVHITCSSETYIAWSLIQNKILVNEYCISYAGVNKLKFWKIQLPGDRTSFNGSTSFSSYTIYAVPQTNIFVIVKYSRSSESTQYCGCSQRFQTSPTCQMPVADSSQCEFPCFVQPEYSDICRGQLAYPTTLAPCIPPAVPVSFASQILEEIPISTTLCNCSMDVCETSTIAAATTTTTTTTPTTTATTTTTTTTTTTATTMNKTSNPLLESPASSSSVLGPAIGIPVGIVVALIIIIIIIVLIVRYKIRDTNYDTPKQPDTSPPSFRPFVTVIPVFDQSTKAAQPSEEMRHVVSQGINGPDNHYQTLRESVSSSDT